MAEFTNLGAVAGAAARALTGGPLLGGMVSGGMLALGVAMLLAILLRRSGRYYGKLKRQARQSGKPDSRQRSPGQASSAQTRRQTQLAGMFDRASPLLDAPATVVRWQVEMQELARELKAEIGTKICVLEVLTRRANEAAQRLEAAAARAQQLGCVPRSDDDPADPVESFLRQAAAGPPPPPSPPIPPCSDQVHAMAAAGANAAAIAEQTGLPIGEVEFVLSLRRAGSNDECLTSIDKGRTTED